MATKTWIGGAGGLYATTTNWSPTGVPVAADDIVFTGDATPNVGTTARTVRHVTVQAGTVTFSGTGAFTIQGDINNSDTLNMNTFTTNFTGGNSQTLNLGTNSFASCTINKTGGTLVTLNAAWNVTGTATATLTVTNGNLTTQGHTITCRAFLASGNTDRTITLNGGAIYVTGTSGTLWNTSHTTATGTAWTKFDRTGAAYIQPSGGTTATITGGGIASNYTAGATFNGVPPTFVLDNNKTYTTTGQFENLTLNGNFAGTSTPQIWGNLNGTPTSYTNTTTCNPVIIGRTGVTNTVDWMAQVTSYTTQNPLSGTPTFTFSYARAITFNLSSNTSTYNLWIDSNDTTGAAWATPAYTVNCNGTSCTYNEYVISSSTTLTYNGNGSASTYSHNNFYDNNTASSITFGGSTSSVHAVTTFDTLGTITFNIGTLTLNSSIYCRVFASATAASSNIRVWNFQQNWIYVNGNHRSGTNGTGTLTVTTLNNTVCSSDVNNQNGGFYLQTTGTCATGSWPDSGVPNMIVEALGGTTLNASINNCNVRNLTFYGPVNFATSQTVNLINSSTTVAWNESGAAFNLTNLTATIACSTGGTFDILRNGSSLGNANWRLGTLSTLTTSLGDNQTVTILGYVRTLSLTKNTGTFNLDDLDFAQTITCSGTANTNYYYNNVRNNNPFTTTWTPITGTAVTAAVAVTQVGVKSTSGSGSGASFNVTKAVNQLTYGSATITVAALGDGYVVGDTITLSGANLGGADGTNDLTFTITAATQATLSGISDGAVTASISGTAVNTAQTRTNVPVKSTSGSGTGALFSVTKTGTGVVYFGVTTVIRTTDGSGYNYGDTITLSGLDIGGVDGTNDLTFTFGQATEHYVTGGSDFVCENTLDHTAGDLEISAARTMYCRTFQSTSTTNIRNWRWNGWIQTSGTGLVSIGSAGANIKGNFLDTYSGGFKVIGTGANAFGTNVGVNAPRIQLGTDDGSARAYTSINGNVGPVHFYNNNFTFSSASAITSYGNISNASSFGVTWTNLTINWQPLRSGAYFNVYYITGDPAVDFPASPTIPTININTPVSTADNGITVFIEAKCNNFNVSTTHNYIIQTGSYGLGVGTAMSITGNNVYFDFTKLWSQKTVANPTFTLGAATSTDNTYAISGIQNYAGGQNLTDVNFVQLGGVSHWNISATFRDFTFTGPGTVNLNTVQNMRNITLSANANSKTFNLNNLIHILSGVPTVSATSTNITIQNPGGFDVTGTGTINLAGLSAAAENNFDIYWRTSNTFTTASAIRNLRIYSGAVLSTSSAITVNIRGEVTSPDDSGGTGPFTGLTIQFPLVADNLGLNQLYNVVTPTSLTAVTVLGNCTVNNCRATTINLNSGAGCTVTLDNPLALTSTAVSCGGTDATYNINTLDLSGTGTANRLTFNGSGTLNVGSSSVTVGNFTISDTTLSRTLNFGTNFISIKDGGLINCAMNTTSVITTTEKHTLSGAGGIGLTSPATVTLTVTGQTESNALNLKCFAAPTFFLVTITFAGTLAWRNLDVMGSTITNSSGTFTVYGDFFVGSGSFGDGGGVWPARTVNFVGNDPNVPQFIGTSGYVGDNFGPTTSTMSGDSPKIIGERGWAEGSGAVFIKSLTANNTTMIIQKNVFLNCDSITVNGGTFKTYGDIYVNNWNTSNTVQYFWEGNGYLRIGEDRSKNPTTWNFPFGSAYQGNSLWNSSTIFNSTNNRGAGTGPNLIMRDSSQGYYTYASANTSNPHRVKSLYLAGTSYNDANLVFKVSQSVFNENSSNVNFSNLNLILDSSNNASNNLSVNSSYNMSTAANRLPIHSITSSSTLTILPTSSNVSFSNLSFSDLTSKFITNSKNVSCNTLVTGTADLSNSIITLTGNNIVFNALNVLSNSSITTTKNYSRRVGNFSSGGWTTTPDLRYITVSQNTATSINLSNNSFTIECWIWPEESYSTQLSWYTGGTWDYSESDWPPPNISLISKKSTNDTRSQTKNWELFLQPWTSYPGFYDGTNSYISSTKIIPRAWNHIAAAFNKPTNTLKIFLNGNSILQTGMTDVSHSNNIQLMIGDYFEGYIKDVRIVKNAVVYNSAFANSLPSAPLEIYSSGTTELLTCQNITLIDNSSSPKTVSNTGIVSAHLFSPTTYKNNSEIILNGSGDKTIFVLGNNLNTITNNSQFTHTGSGEGTGWITLAHVENKTIDTIRNGNGNFSKAIKTLRYSLDGYGEDVYTTPGTYSWTCPVGVTSVSVVAIGGGGGGGDPWYNWPYTGDQSYGGGGGGLGWKNNISVTPGQTYTVVVGAGGFGSDNTNQGGDSYFIDVNTVKGGGGKNGKSPDYYPTEYVGLGGDYVGDGGGNGGRGNYKSGQYTGGGAGGYTGNGGDGGDTSNDYPATNGSGGGGGGASDQSGAGGGVGLYGIGNNGAKGVAGGGGGGGSGGANAPTITNYRAGSTGGGYGGGAGASLGVLNGFMGEAGGVGAGGAVRIIWPGTSRAFPFLNVGA